MSCHLLRCAVFRGSSPRIRGKCRSVRRQTRRLGIIPANTGKIRVSAAGTFPSRDHPREYGENPIAPGKQADFEGSSPRIRGKSDAAAMAVDNAGIIPANTGKISVFRGIGRAVWDHPREYGENAQRTYLSTVEDGIIPANTGKIQAVFAHPRERGDHPREYGENHGERWNHTAPPGSSPRIRGKCMGP